MKFTLNEKPEKQQPINIYTDIDNDGDVRVYVVRPDGTSAIILWLRQTGVVLLGCKQDAEYLKTLGFTLNENGQVLVRS